MQSQNKTNKSSAPNRSVPPPLQELGEVNTARAERISLDNGLEVFIIPSTQMEAIRVDLMVRSGRPAERKPMVSRAVGSLISRGTKSYERKEIAEMMEFRGAQLYSRGETDAIAIGMFATRRTAGELVPLLAEMVMHPTFPEKELIKFIKRYKQKLTESLNNPSLTAYRKLTEELFGPGHPYGYNSSVEKLEALRSDDLVKFKLRQFTPGRTALILSGAVDDYFIDRIREAFDPWVGQSPAEPLLPEPARKKPSRIRLERKRNAPQLSFAMGRHSINRPHEDYYELFVLSMLLGGYFGSRLIRNIREEKGLAYDISCSLDSFRYAGLLTIAGECTASEGDHVLDEIGREMRRLANEEISPDELLMVKNYIIGLLMNNIDGPVNTAEVLRTYLAEGCDLGEIDRLLESLAGLDPAGLGRLAGKYLDPDDFHIVSVS